MGQQGAMALAFLSLACRLTNILIFAAGVLPAALEDET